MIEIERNQVEGVLDNVRVPSQRPNILTETYQTKEETEKHTQSRKPTIYFPQKFNLSNTYISSEILGNSL